MRFIFVSIGLLAIGCGANDGASELLSAAGGDAAPSASEPRLRDGASASVDTNPQTETPPRTVVVVHYPRNGKDVALEVEGSMQMSIEQSTEDAVTFALPMLSMGFSVALSGKRALGPAYRAEAGRTTHVYPRFFTAAGSVAQRTGAYVTPRIPSARGIWVYTPPSYNENPTARFPVLYMHDGSTLFDPSTVNGPGDLRVDEILDAGAADGTIREIIVVGIGSNENRFNELTPPRTRSTGSTGIGDKYLDMIVDEIKPAIDRDFRTLSDRDNTGVMGYSLGGLISLEAGLLRGATFGIIGAQSPSAWYDERILVDQVRVWQTQEKPKRVYVDCGDATDMLGDISDVASGMRAAGFKDGDNMKFVADPSGKHDVRSWNSRLPGAFRFMFGPR